MRTINSIIIHCTATKPLAHINVNDVRRWHRERGFSDIGYHYLILVDGTVEAGRPLSAIGAHCKGHNAHSIGICYVGGLNDKGKPADTRTPAQCEAMRTLLTSLKHRFPDATIHGHRDFATKACPCFDATAEYAYLSTERINPDTEPMNTIPLIAVLITLCLLFFCPSCKTVAPTVTTPHNDSIVIRNIYHHDSIYLHDSMAVEYKLGLSNNVLAHVLTAEGDLTDACIGPTSAPCRVDTLLVHEWHTDIRYSIKHHTDTIYQDKETVITLPPEKYIPPFYRWCTRILFFAICCILAYLVLRLVIKYYTLR